MITIRRAEARGHANHGWLDTWHTFSFANYWDPRHMGFGHLRVINEDRVAPGAGFPPHGHRNMEIVSYVVSGGLAHRDSTGGGGVIRPGQVQAMSAGRGVLHSEMNASRTEPVHFLQIWLQPAEAETEPWYADRDFGLRDGLTLLVSPDARDGSLRLGQDVDIHRALLDEGQRASLDLRRNQAWVQVVNGKVTVNGTPLMPGDGAAVTGEAAIELVAVERCQALVFDLT